MTKKFRGKLHLEEFFGTLIETFLPVKILAERIVCLMELTPEIIYSFKGCPKIARDGFDLILQKS